MRASRVTLIAAIVVALVATPAVSHAAVDPTGAAITATASERPDEQPDAYRTVDGAREPVYRVRLGDTLHVTTTIANTGSR
ncbi:hypothetical protein, partial [Klebsiella pneumoniae]